MPKNKVLSLNQKAQICEASLAPGFDKEHCIKRFEISRSCLNRILRNKDQFLTFYDLVGRVKNPEPRTSDFSTDPDFSTDLLLTTAVLKSGSDCTDYYISFSAVQFSSLILII